jgi:hypothetical protein
MADFREEGESKADPPHEQRVAKEEEPKNEKGLRSEIDRASAGVIGVEGGGKGSVANATAEQP